MEAELAEPSCEAEVGEVDVLVTVEQHVRRLDVAMDESALVRGVERGGDLRTDRERPSASSGASAAAAT